MKLNDENYSTPLTIIAYEMEVLKPNGRERLHDDSLRLQCMQEIRDSADHIDRFIRRDPIQCEPGRVMVSHEVMSALGYTVVNHHLNRLMRSYGCDGPCCGEQIAYAIYYERYLESCWPLTDVIWLLIAVNHARTRTVIRFMHERLEARRRCHRA